MRQRAGGNRLATVGTLWKATVEATTGMEAQVDMVGRYPAVTGQLRATAMAKPEAMFIPNMEPSSSLCFPCPQAKPHWLKA